MPFVLGCGTCEQCRAGDAQVCPDQEQPGFTLPGSFAERVALPRADANLVRLPDDLSFVAAASLGCRFATAYRAVVTHGAVRPGQWVAVHGCGGVGLSAVMVAKALGARVVAVDISTAALDAARDLGADEATDAARGGPRPHRRWRARLARRPRPRHGRGRRHRRAASAREARAGRAAPR